MSRGPGSVAPPRPLPLSAPLAGLLALLSACANGAGPSRPPDSPPDTGGTTGAGGSRPQGGSPGGGATGGAVGGPKGSGTGAGGGATGSGGSPVGAGGAGGAAGATGSPDAATPAADAGGGKADASAADAGPPATDDPPTDGGVHLPGVPAGDPGPIGAGWTEIFPVYKVDQPPGQIRYTLSGTEFHFWLFNNDMSTFPGRDSGPRSELHIINNYMTGQAQFQADIKIDANCSRASIMQIFGGSRTATGFMAWAMSNSLNHYSNEVIFSPIYGRYFRLNVTHDTASGRVEVYIDGQKKGTFQDHGPGKHYFKCGLYHQAGMSARCDDYIKNIRVFQK
jgi:hypothetical protein